MAGAWTSAQAADNAPASTPFAIISPKLAEALKDQASTPEAQAIIKVADDGLSKTPDPIPKIHVEGILPHQGLWDVSLKAEQDWPLIQAFGFAYRLTGDRKYLDAEDKFLSAWMDVYKPSFDPIDETPMDQFILGYDLTRADLSADTKAKMDTFLRALATGYLDAISKQVTNGKVDIDNWQSHRIKLITLSAFALGDDALIDQAHKVFLDHLAVNINPEGMVDDFVKRDALHYVLYDLGPLDMAALAAKSHGQDWFHASSSNGSSLMLATDWLTPFALGEKTHEEFVHSKIGFDAQRARAGMKGYSGPFEPATSLTLYQLSAMLDPKYETTYQQICQNAGSGHSPSNWMVLVTKAGL